MPKVLLLPSNVARRYYIHNYEGFPNRIYHWSSGVYSQSSPFAVFGMGNLFIFVIHILGFKNFVHP